MESMDYDFQAYMLFESMNSDMSNAQKIFETNAQEKGWDGKYEGMLADPGVFVYYLNIVYCDGEKYFEKWNVTLIH